MSGVWLRFGAEWRAHWRAWLGLSLLAGVLGGSVGAAALGAQRTESAYRRFLVSHRAFDAIVVPEFCEPPADCSLARVGTLPQVAESATLGVRDLGQLRQGSRDLSGLILELSILPVSSVDGALGESVNRLKILDGRRADPASVDEVVVGVEVARELDVAVGDELTASFLVEQEVDDLPTHALRVVGIGVAPFEIRPPSGNALFIIHLTPAFERWARAEALRGIEAVAVRLAPGATLADLTAELERREIAGVPAFHQTSQTDAVERSTDTYAVGLAALAALLALAGAVVVGQLLARQAYRDSLDDATLRAIGFTRRRLAVLVAWRAAAIAAIALVSAMAVATFGSSFAPFGLARTVEPRPGWRFGGDVLLVAFATALLAFGVAAVAGLLRIRRGGNRPDARAIGVLPRVTARLLGSGTVPPPLGAGIRHALEPGRGRTAVPVRSGITAATVAVVGIVGALAFGAGLDHLVRTPRLSGWNWDVSIPWPSAPDRDAPATVDQVAAVLDSDPEVAAWAPAILGQPFTDQALEVGGIPVTTLALGDGGIEPTLIRGRAPRGDDEILVGSDLRRELDVEIGDTVEVQGQRGDTGGPDAYTESRTEMTVVGVGVIPVIPDDAAGGSGHRLGQGAAITMAGVRRLDPVAFGNRIFLSVAPGGDAEGVKARLYAAMHAPNDEPIQGAETPGSLLDLQQVDELPLVLAGLMCALGASTIAHVVVSAARARRRDLALLKVLGFTRAQLRRVVAWQAVTLSLAAMVVGVPFGLLLGRSTWSVFAGNLGVRAEPVVPWPELGALVAGTIVVALLLAAIPSRRASRLRPALVLRTE